MALLNNTVRVASRVAASSVRTSAPIRTKTSLIPPNVSSLKELGKLQSAYPQAHPEIFLKMKNFYKAIPKGNREQTASKTFWGKYYEKYIAKDSFVPVLHFLGVMIPTGYYISYFQGGYKSLDLRSNPELYRVGRGEEGVLSVEPYKSELLPHWRFKTPQLAEKSSETLLFRFHGYLAKDDFVGADMARKFVQMGYSRSLRYAYHKGGKKYQKVDGNEKIELPRDAEQDEEKAECARIFHAVLERMKADQRYQDLEAQHREKYDHQEIPSMSGDEVDVKEVEKAKTPKKVSLAQQRKRAAAEAEDSKTEAEERRPKGTFTAEAAQPKAKKARATVKEPIEPQRTSSRLRHKKDPA
ncbi:hypothetical protein HKX48_002341 [Thoreauomyces humboldtii]|nr:hypothetical protein HKX48_002341 [Thoreauomyces humboldtii]